VEDVSSLFLQGVSHDICLPGIKEKKIMYEQPEAAGPTIPKMDIFDGITVLEEDHINEGQPLFDVYYSDDEQQAYPTFDHYKDTEEQSASRTTPWSLFMMNTNRTWGRAKKKSRKNQWNR
jgi:hypothetical protein